jgi:hypothetical protein
VKEHERSYGSLFDNQDDDKLKMPSLVWNASISSSRHLNNLESIRLVNYKEYYDDKGQLKSDHSPKKTLPKIQVQFNWRNDALCSMVNINGE